MGFENKAPLNRCLVARRSRISRPCGDLRSRRRHRRAAAGAAPGAGKLNPNLVFRRLEILRHQSHDEAEFALFRDPRERAVRIVL